MKTYKQIEDGVITAIGKSTIIPSNGVEITEEKYDEIMSVIQSHPDDTLDVHYYLSAETESYVGRETTHAEKVDWYVNAVMAGTMTIEDVPEDYREEVEAKQPQPEPTAHTLDEYANLLAQEVSA